MIDKLLVPIISLSGMGIIFGALLAYASKKFEVKTDERVSMVIEVLPSANCGACGYAGCSGFAAAVVEGKAPVEGCIAGGVECASLVAEIMGVSAAKKERLIARMMCNGTKDNASEKYIYHGVSDCSLATQLGEGPIACSYGCMGMGTCVKACKFNAITIKNGIAVIDENKCTGCGVCVKACPKNIIELLPESKITWVMCRSQDKGKDMKLTCKTGCIACGICEKVCEHDAIHVNNNIASIDYDKCVNCGVCVQKCPKKIIVQK
jgi:electron transport complex protein RnfB